MEYSVSKFFESQGKDDPTRNFGWDYILVDNDKVVNARYARRKDCGIHWASQSYKNTDALSVVMGREIAHAVARHSLERMSHAMTINLHNSCRYFFRWCY